MLLIYSLVICGFWLLFTIYLLFNKRKVGWLKDVPPLKTEQPGVVIIVAVRNEEEHLAHALKSVCSLDYTNYRILVINDRSTDGTGAILTSFRERFPHLLVHEINELPSGWLGKNHALYEGYRNSQEPWILFTDADIVYKPDTLARAMRYASTKELDHLTLLPEVRSRSEWLNSILSTFVLLLEGKHRPWALHKPGSRSSYLGIGAFNLVRRTVYERMGTHSAFPMRPDDDLMLGKRMKDSGGRSDALYATGLISLEWYTSVKEFVNGLMKNSFSAFNYQLGRLLVTGVLPMLIFFVLPVPVILAYDYRLGLCLIATWLLLFSLAQGSNTRWWHALMLPVAGAVMAYILLKAGMLAKKQKGIYWREHFYPIEELRAGL